MLQERSIASVVQAYIQQFVCKGKHIFTAEIWHWWGHSTRLGHAIVRLLPEQLQPELRYRIGRKSNDLQCSMRSEHPIAGDIIMRYSSCRAMNCEGRETSFYLRCGKA
jgi:hypothetical protein